MQDKKSPELLATLAVALRDVFQPQAHPQAHNMQYERMVPTGIPDDPKPFLRVLK